MDLNNLTKITTKRKRRLGQGHGSGRVKTSGRGTKGQNARSSRPLRFEGGALPLTKRLPFLRGKLKNKSFRTKSLVLNVCQLNVLPKNSVVTVESLIRHGLVDSSSAKILGVKILGDGELSNILTVKLSVSKSAKEKITKAGGSVSN